MIVRPRQDVRTSCGFARKAHSGCRVGHQAKLRTSPRSLTLSETATLTFCRTLLPRVMLYGTPLAAGCAGPWAPGSIFFPPEQTNRGDPTAGSLSRRTLSRGLKLALPCGQWPFDATHSISSLDARTQRGGGVGAYRLNGCDRGHQPGLRLTRGRRSRRWQDDRSLTPNWTWCRIAASPPGPARA